MTDGFSFDQITAQLPEALSVGVTAWSMIYFKDSIPGGAPEWLLAAVGVAVGCAAYRKFANGEDWGSIGGGYRTPFAMAAAVAGAMYPKFGDVAMSVGISAVIGDIAGKLYEDNYSS